MARYNVLPPSRTGRTRRKGRTRREERGKGFGPRRRSAVALSHCTEAIGLLTGSGWVLAFLLAVGVDAGMVAAEWAALTAHGKPAGEEVGRWANGYVALCRLR